MESKFKIGQIWENDLFEIVITEVRDNFNYEIQFKHINSGSGTGFMTISKKKILRDYKLKKQVFEDVAIGQIWGSYSSLQRGKSAYFQAENIVIVNLKNRTITTQPYIIQFFGVRNQEYLHPKLWTMASQLFLSEYYFIC